MIFTIDRVYRHKDRLLFRNVLLPWTIEPKLFRMGGEEAAGRAGIGSDGKTALVD